MEGSDRLENDRGAYILLMELEKTQKIKPGRLAEADFKKGMYLYVGRARKGLQARIRRHVREEKKLFWHIDYLLRTAKLREIWTRKNFFDECRIASKLRDLLSPPSPIHKGFGSTDCRCPGHLLYVSSPEIKVRPLLQKMKFQKVAFNGNKPKAYRRRSLSF
jgi:Uri superfamily endonuclease